MENNKLEKLRKKIDKIDRNISKELSKRFDIVSEIAKFKKENNIKIVDKEREKKILSYVEECSQKNFIYIKEIYKLIFSLSKKKQNRRF